MGKSQREKGARLERKVRARHEADGILCLKVPLSGAVAGFKGDLIVARPDADPSRTTTLLKYLDKFKGYSRSDWFVAEVKGRGKGQGFKLITNWLGDNDMLFLLEDRKDPLVVLPWTTYKQLLAPDTPTINP